MSQNQRILKYLQTGKTLTPLQALNKFGCFRLAARIYNLREDGWPINAERVRVGQKWVTRYGMSRDYGRLGQNAARS